MDDPAVTSALADAARRGVDVKVIMTADSEWDPAFNRLTRAGVHVRLYPDDSALYVHAKVIVADAGRPAHCLQCEPRLEQRVRAFQLAAQDRDGAR
jgi:PLD-like domain